MPSLESITLKEGKALHNSELAQEVLKLFVLYHPPQRSRQLNQGDAPATLHTLERGGTSCVPEQVETVY